MSCWGPSSSLFSASLPPSSPSLSSLSASSLSTTASMEKEGPERLTRWREFLGPLVVVAFGVDAAVVAVVVVVVVVVVVDFGVVAAVIAVVVGL